MDTGRFADADGPPSESAILAALHQFEVGRVDLAIGVARFAKSGEWAADGAVSIASWLRHRMCMSNSDAGRLVSEGKFLLRFSELADAVVTGQLSWGQLAEIRKAVHPRFDHLLAGEFDTDGQDASGDPIMKRRETQMLDTIVGMDFAETRSACSRWREWAENTVPEKPFPEEPERMLSFAPTAEGGVIGRFVLDAEGAAQFDKALSKSMTWNPDETRTLQQRQADGRRDMCAFVNANHPTGDAPTNRANLELIGTADDLDAFHSKVRTFAGDAFQPHQTQALLCDCVVHRILSAGLAKLDYGTATRTVSLNLWRVLALRDGGCRFPGCDRPGSWCEAHHITHWIAGGRTDQSNLVLLCSHHHHLIHKHGWTIVLQPEGDLIATGPTGNTLVSKPRGPTQITKPFAA